VSRPRAAVVATGSELVRGERTDLNGPWLARQALSLGLEPVRVTVVGDTVAELEDALRDGLRADLLLVSGGLGPTHDDRTVELVARVTDRSVEVRPELEREIEAVSRMVAERLNRPYTDFAPGVRKQATLPEGAVAIGLAGTAPGSVLDAGDCVVVLLPGPPGELRRLWPGALATGAVQRVLARATPPQHRVLRFFGVSESAVAQALAAAGGDGAGVDATICARDFEIHVDLYLEPGAEERGEALAAALREPLARWLYGEDERGVEVHVLELCRERDLTLGTAESCTGGLVAARLTSVPGSSDVFRGAIVAYADEVKAVELGVPEAVLAENGAVSAPTAGAMARGARDRLGVDVAVSVTGIAGPGGGTAQKPVGLVYLHASGPDGELAAEFSLPGDREAIRRRAAVSALHLVRRLLSQSRDEDVRNG
jgi:nicotinamide-nucleotide amidase